MWYNPSMAETIKIAIKTLAGGVKHITLAPQPRPRHIRQSPSRYWIRAGERLSRATAEVGRELAKQA